MKLGEWHSELRCYIQNQRDPSSNPTECSPGPWDQTSLQGSRWQLGQISINRGDYYWISKATPSKVAQSWPWGNQAAVKKTVFLYCFYSVRNSLGTLWRWSLTVILHLLLVQNNESKFPSICIVWTLFYGNFLQCSIFNLSIKRYSWNQELLSFIVNSTRKR